MNKFSDFNIEIKVETFVGEKIKIKKIIGDEIIVIDYKLTDSKIYKDKGTGKCLQLQISFNNEKRIIFTSASFLINAITQIDKQSFPFTTKIIEENERFKFI